MTASEELERMADAFASRRTTCAAYASGALGDEQTYGILMAKADAFLEVETELRARAAELRSQGFRLRNEAFGNGAGA